MASNKIRDPQTVTVFVIVGLLVGAWVILEAGVRVWAWMGGPVISEVNPIRIVSGALSHRWGDPHGLWVACGLVAVVIAGLAGVMWAGVKWSRRGVKRGDEMAKHAGKGRDLKPLMTKAVQAKAKRFGTQCVYPGLPIGVSICGGTILWSSYEDVTTQIGGPRQGKTTRWVVPRILAAPGCVVATSNKADIVEHVAAARAASTGEGVWVFDPQNLCGAGRRMWWDPLSGITDLPSAYSLASLMISAAHQNARSGGVFTGGDPYFRQAGIEVLGLYLYAAKLAGEPIEQAGWWLNRETDPVPAELLAQAGQAHAASKLASYNEMTERTRNGMYGEARMGLSWLASPEIVAWTKPGLGAVAFSPQHFVTTRQTLLCLSQESDGSGSAGPLVAALTVAVTQAAMAYASSLPGGRFATPMLIELDEAANVCPWRELPRLYSHFGSRGICIDTLLQSWSQGEAVWGRDGMWQLWSNANVAMYIGNVKEAEFLEALSKLIGTYEANSRQVSVGEGRRSVSVGEDAHVRPIASVSDLAALPQGRGWVVSASTPAVMVETLDWAGWQKYLKKFDHNANRERRWPWLAKR